MAFSGNNMETDSTLEEMREYLASRLGIPVLLSYGFRYLRNFEQVYKGGPANGLFLIITSQSLEDIAILGAGYTFGQLQLVLMLSEWQSLVSQRLLTVTCISCRV